MVDACVRCLADCTNDPCKDKDCSKHGKCSAASGGGYQCKCDAGYEGTNCEKNIDECSAPKKVTCSNNGKCVDGENKYTCKCKDGFEGKDCETDIDECKVPKEVTCNYRGKCVDGVNKYSCKCEDGFEGKNCEVSSRVAPFIRVL